MCLGNSFYELHLNLVDISKLKFSNVLNLNSLGLLAPSVKRSLPIFIIAVILLPPMNKIASPAHPEFSVWLTMILLISSLTACTAKGTLSVMDPYLGGYSPAIASLYEKTARETVTLKTETMSSGLFSELQLKKPGRVFLSPFLASEIPAILDSFPDTLVGFVGTTKIKEDPRLFSVEFMETRAAVQAAALIADYCKTLGPGPAAVAALLPGQNYAELAEAFKKGLKDSGSDATPYILELSQEFSIDAVSSLKNLDIRAAFVAVPGSVGSQYKRHLFGAAAYVVELQPLFSGKDPLTDAVLSWDFKAALENIAIRMDNKKSGNERLAWKESK